MGKLIVGYIPTMSLHVRESLIKRASIACSQRDIEDWNRWAAEEGLTMSAWVRRCLAEYRVVKDMTAEQFRAWKDAGEVLRSLGGTSWGTGPGR